MPEEQHFDFLKPYCYHNRCDDNDDDNDYENHGDNNNGDHDCDEKENIPIEGAVAGTWLLGCFHHVHDDNNLHDDDNSDDDDNDDNDDDNDDEKANATIEGALAGCCPVVGGWHASVI